MGLIFSFLENWLVNMMFSLAEFVMSLTNNLSNNFWETDIIKAFITFTSWTGILVIVCSIAFLLFDILEERVSNKPILWGMIFSNLFKAFVFVMSVPLLVVGSSKLATMITESFGIKKPEISLFETIMNGFLTQQVNFIITLIIFVILIIGIISFFIMSLMRFSNMLIHMLGSVFYIADIIRGNTVSIGDWLRQMIAMISTYIIQFIFFSTGLSIIVDNGALSFTNGTLFMGLSLWAGMFGVSKILAKFGMSSGTMGILSGASNVAMKIKGVLS